MPRQSTKVERACEICGESFHTTPSAVKRGGGKYCSQRCYHQSESRRPHLVNCVCQQCGKTFGVWPTRTRREGGAKFCSVACRTASLAVTAEEVFRRHVGEPTEKGCLLWTGSVQPDGYGRAKCRAARGQVAAHRLAWEIANGPIPDGLMVLHCCDELYPPGDVTNRRCVNVEHLFLGTHRDNMDDMVTKGRQLRGERNPRAKTNADTVRAIRARWQEGGITQIQLAADHNTTPMNVSAIVSGRTWKHLT